MEIEISQAPTPTTAPALTVSELTLRIKNQLEQEYPSVAVQGELSNYKRHSSGHLYFTLKDENAQLSVAMFQPLAARLNFEPKDGDKVIVRGQITVYSQRGSYQMVARQMEKVGLGDILLQLEALKKELKALGWLEPSAKKKVPPQPERIGVITSPTGAVIRDIINVLSHRHPGFHLILYPTRVQGATAASEIAQGIAYLNKHKLCDVLIIARGGGSFEDLLPFNDRVLLEAVHSSQIPTISAVGHETDFTLCDFVADLRAPTPSAAAERVLPSKKEWKDKLGLFSQSIERRLQGLIEGHKAHLRALEKHQVLSEPMSLLHARSQFLDDMKEHLHRHIAHRLEKALLQLSHYKQRLSLEALIELHQRQKERLLNISFQHLQSFQHLVAQQDMRIKLTLPQLKDRLLSHFQNCKQRLTLVQGLLSVQRLIELYALQQAKLEAASQVLQALSPEAAMKRGYAILKQADGSKAPKIWQNNETLLIETASQILLARVQESRPKKTKQQLELFD